MREQFPQERGEPTSDFTTKISWLIEAIALQDPSQKEDREWLESFLFAITGKKAMEPGMKLYLQENQQRGLVFEMSTCFNKLNVPKCSVDKENFLGALNIGISGESYNSQ